MNDEMEKAAKEAERLYGDILYMEHPVSKRHHPAPRTSRAAQFSPFAALSGYDAAIRETARLTEEKPELSEEQKQHLNDVITRILQSNGTRTASIVYFELDERKEGGHFTRISAPVRRVTAEYLETAERKKIPLDDIIEIEEE